MTQLKILLNRINSTKVSTRVIFLILLFLVIASVTSAAVSSGPNVGIPEIIVLFVLLILGLPILITILVIAAGVRLGSRKPAEPTAQSATTEDPIFKCPQCQEQINHSAKYCEHCGKKLSWELRVKE